jgi:hypothetical protein
VARDRAALAEALRHGPAAGVAMREIVNGIFYMMRAVTSSSPARTARSASSSWAQGSGNKPALRPTEIRPFGSLLRGDPNDANQFLTVTQCDPCTRSSKKNAKSSNKFVLNQTDGANNLGEFFCNVAITDHAPYVEARGFVSPGHVQSGSPVDG